MVHEATAAATLPEPPPGSVAELFRQALPDVEFTAGQTPIDVAITVRRDDFARVMEAAKEHDLLAFDYLRCVSGVDHISELEVVYHLYSFKHRHSVAVKVRCPYEDPHVPTLTHLYAAANWLERETHEMYGIVFDGHPDLRPLLTEEGLGYYILRKSHPLADIEEWQEDYLEAIEQARAQMTAGAPEGAAAPPLDERAQKVALAQKKAAFIKQVREEARAKGMTPEDEKAAVQAALKRFEEEQAAAQAEAAATTAAPPAAPADDRAAKIQLAQKKAAVIKQARDEARAQGLSPEDERTAVAEALKALAEGEKGG